jgi:hypothetical protein
MQPDLGSLGLLVALSLQLLLELSGLGSMAVAVLAEGLAERRGQVFLRKLAQQVSAMGVWLLGYSAISGGAMLWLIAANLPQSLEPWTSNPILALPLLGPLAGVLLFAVLYRTTWGALRERKTLHRILGLAATLCALVLMAASLAAKLTLAGAPAIAPPANLGELYLFPPHDQYWPMLAHAVLWALTGAAGLGLVYLLMRRNRDDFGRDYYTFAVRVCARWAAIPALLQLAAAAAVLLPAWGRVPQAMKSTALGLAAGGAMAAVLAAILLLNVSRAEAPLRHKPAILGAVVLLAAALAGPTGAIMLVVYG